MLDYIIMPPFIIYLTCSLLTSNKIFHFVEIFIIVLWNITCSIQYHVLLHICMHQTFCVRIFVGGICLSPEIVGFICFLFSLLAFFKSRVSKNSVENFIRWCNALNILVCSSFGACV